MSLEGKTILVTGAARRVERPKKLLAHAESAARHTVEALVSDLARLCLEQPGVTGVRIRVEKPGSVGFARSVGVEIEWFNES